MRLEQINPNVAARADPRALHLESGNRPLTERDQRPCEGQKGLPLARERAPLPASRDQNPAKRVLQPLQPDGHPGEHAVRRTGMVEDVAQPQERVRRELGSTEAVKRAVAAGLGVSLVLESAVVDEVAAGRMAALPVSGATLEKTLWAIAPRDLLSHGQTAEVMRLLMEPGS